MFYAFDQSDSALFVQKIWGTALYIFFFRKNKLEVRATLRLLEFKSVIDELKS